MVATTFKSATSFYSGDKFVNQPNSDLSIYSGSTLVHPVSARMVLFVRNTEHTRALPLRTRDFSFEDGRYKNTNHSLHRRRMAPRHKHVLHTVDAFFAIRMIVDSGHTEADVTIPIFVIPDCPVHMCFFQVLY